MYISNPDLVSLIQSNNLQQTTNKSNLQNELDCFESILKTQLLNSTDSIANSLLTDPIFSNQDTSPSLYNSDNQLFTCLSQLFSSLIQNKTLGDGNSSLTSTNAPSSISYNNQAQIYSQNATAYSNATPSEYNKLFSGDVFLGDSITKGLSAYKILDDSKVYAKVGIGTNKVEEMVDSAAKQNPQRVFIMSGVNDVGSYNNTQFAQHYTDLIKTVKAKCPNAKIYVQSILPVLDQATERNPALNNDRINEFNSIISQISKKENVGFLNTAALSSSNITLYANDGIHYKPAFYPAWLNFLQTHTN